jgi:plastocyanin
MTFSLMREAKIRTAKMRVTMRMACALTVVLLTAAAALAGEQTVDQKDKMFVLNGAKIETFKVKIGDVIQFKNLDPFFHNIFSLSDAKLFDLGSYPQGQSRSVTFDKAGKVEVECAIHPQMKLTVEVVK